MALIVAYQENRVVKRVVLISAVLFSLLITPLTVGPRHGQVADAVFPPVEQTVVT